MSRYGNWSGNAMGAGGQTIEAAAVNQWASTGVISRSSYHASSKNRRHEVPDYMGGPIDPKSMNNRRSRAFICPNVETPTSKPAAMSSAITDALVNERRIALGLPLQPTG